MYTSFYFQIPAGVIPILLMRKI